jgi:hypothetical protein
VIEMIKYNRMLAIASKDTFTIPPIKELLDRYVKPSELWIDPFCGWNSPAQITNDHNPAVTPAKYHMEAVDFANWLDAEYDGVLFDPPYSYRQVSEHYQVIGKKATQLDTSTNFYNRVKMPIAPKIKAGGLAICFGWNSNGFGKKLGFEIIEVLLIAHGGHHNDTIVTIERKMFQSLGSEAIRKAAQVKE